MATRVHPKSIVIPLDWTGESRSISASSQAETDMYEDRPAFGQRLAERAELGVIKFRPEPLDDSVEQRLKTIRKARACPNCGSDSLQALNGSDCVWCGRCNWKTTYTRGTPFYGSELTPMSSSSPPFSTPIRSSALLRSPCSSHRTTHRFTTSLGSLKPLSVADLRPSGSASLRQSMGRHRSMKYNRCA
jgi:ribosomal protein S27AE